jgi:hypothetical protein
MLSFVSPGPAINYDLVPDPVPAEEEIQRFTRDRDREIARSPDCLSMVRNFYELSLLVPGAVPPAPGSAGSVRGDFAFSVNGAREDANNFLLDGVYNVESEAEHFRCPTVGRCDPRV